MAPNNLVPVLRLGLYVDYLRAPCFPEAESPNSPALRPSQVSVCISSCLTGRCARAQRRVSLTLSDVLERASSPLNGLPEDASVHGINGRLPSAAE